jgi:hypothetical protein
LVYLLKNARAATRSTSLLIPPFWLCKTYKHLNHER